MVTLDTRKPVDRLTLGDLSAFPIWEYADDEEGLAGRDETWVRPVDSRVIPSRSYTIVAADFSFAGGRQFCGSISVSTLDSPVDIFQGVINFASRNYLIPDPEMFGGEKARQELLDGLGASESELFPIQFRLRALIEGEVEYRTGVLA